MEKEKIYYTKIIFESFGCGRPRGLDDWNILLNVAMKELAFERLEWRGGKENVVENFAKKLTDEDFKTMEKVVYDKMVEQQNLLNEILNKKKKKRKNGNN